MKNVPRITRIDLLSWLGTNNTFDTREQLTQLIIELVNDDYPIELLKKDILIYKGAF
tara:strand:+ start:210 stop:380 length:171 start_codon:yes stop_codon:yes gene_type:complete